MWATSVIFQKLPKVKSRPMYVRKFAQSCHPMCENSPNLVTQCTRIRPILSPWLGMQIIRHVCVKDGVFYQKRNNKLVISENKGRGVAKSKTSKN
jgi:hypothetical protein